jgi:hypothetical protein
MFFVTKYSSDTVPFGGMGHVFVKYLMARRVRTEQRRVNGVGGGGGQPGRSTREGLSLHVDMHVDV